MFIGITDKNGKKRCCLSTGQNKKTNEKDNHGDREEKESMVFGAFLLIIIVCNEE